MNINEIINRPKEVRVIASTKSSSDIAQSLIGKDSEVHTEYKDGTMCVAANDEYAYLFNSADVLTLTPLSFKEKRIAFTDEIKVHGEWVIVYGYYWYNGQWHINAGDETLNYGCYRVELSHIADHRTAQSSSRTIEDILAELSDDDKSQLRKALK